ncbi:MAG: hypothetical protein GWN14_04825 [candidate division Zixibacteria bacterium]|nr:hypothetical protein [candidate division Zixibacteria bacterium]NIW41666.1 hypothetical protein [candidate division Zixibacteria bacterium]NIX55259.1 hypothetical protein [candidate division Zixibacteria bacterium]
MINLSMRKSKLTVGSLALFLLLLFIPYVAIYGEGFNKFEEEKQAESGLLPRWREGGTPYDRNQSLEPFTVSFSQKDIPTSGYISSPPEYSPSRGVLFSYFSNGWPEVVRDMVVALTSDPDHDEIAYVCVTSSSQQSHAYSTFSSAGADMSKVEFIIEPMNALWIRDYGPHFMWQNNTLGIVNSQYYPTRPLDNFVPELVGTDHFQVFTYDMGLYYSGGNFQPTQNRNGFVTALIQLDNTTSGGFDPNFIAGLYHTYQGIDTLHIMPQLPFSVDGTGHIDMWMYIIDEDDVIISEFLPGSDPTAIAVTNNAVPYMESLGYTVHRTPAWNSSHPSMGYWTHWTYTNALRVNDRILIPSYGDTYLDYADEDAEALAVWEVAAGPDVEIIPINSYDIIWAAGALHCIAMQVPRYEEAAPSANIIWPDGGELFAGGTVETIQWEATDSNNTDLVEAVLYYSTDDGANYVLIDTVPETGRYDWTVPDIYAEQCRFKVVAVSQDSDEYEAVSAGPFEIASCQQSIYDFSTGAGVDKFAFGHQTSNWSAISGNRTPVSTEIESLISGSYDKISYSDATGNDYDPNRYLSLDPNNGWESTHIFEFTLTDYISEIDDIEIFWEGYSDQCSMMEMYVWDYTSGEWCDGEGLFDQNRFMDNWAGNRDGYLEKHIRSDFNRFVSPGSGQLTVLLYSERGPDGSYVNYNPTLHDYISITVSTKLPQYICGDADANEAVNVSDAVRITNFIFVGGAAPDPFESGDTNCDGTVNISDVVVIINFVFVGGNAPCDVDGDDIPDC